MSLILADKISYAYPAADDEEPKELPGKALDDVSLTIEAGQVVCILGRNGSGKSTFAKHLNALIVPDSGTVWIDGMNSKDQEKLWSIRANVGMVFQNPDNQIIGSVVDEDVAFGPENIGVPSEQIQREVATALENVNMSAYAKASPNKLSGGQKQRVAIAGILAMHPKCIVLDEATAMLDPGGRREVMNTVLELNRQQKITVIAITHYMDEALLADKIFVMDHSKVVMEGTAKEVFSKPEELKKIGLRLPPISDLAYELRKSGLPIPEGIIYPDELKEAILVLCR